METTSLYYWKSLGGKLVSGIKLVFILVSIIGNGDLFLGEGEGGVHSSVGWSKVF